MDLWLIPLQTYVPLVLATIAAIAAVVHILLHKSDPRGAFGWIAVCLLFPLIGPVFYYVFGINRVQVRARRLDKRADHALMGRAIGVHSQALDAQEGVPATLRGLAHAVDALAGAPLVAGNRVTVLENGDQAYPAMLAAIERARRFVYLATYIFETDGLGRQFMEALERAAARGVDVRVLLDGVGEYYAWPRRRPARRLRRNGVRVGRFLAPRLLPPSLRINLRNHRKVLVADGELAFTGGMNIAGRNMSRKGRPPKVADLHFSFCGPVVEQIARVFLDYWAFVTGQRGELPEAEIRGGGASLCRAIDGGPTDETERLDLILSAAVGSAQRRVLLMTPYFLPSPALASALQAAALRGLEVAVVLPARNNLAFVGWATRHGLRELLRRRVQVYYQPAPFAHTKLFVIDDAYAVVGSANIDPRSLRLNFELVVEIYDRSVVAQLTRHIGERIDRSRRCTVAEMDARTLPARLRDALMWLFSPYL
ncbi:MAG: cardiolipin synthase [Salinisphaera sp.]|nr:cardiolipin synthase [Salinisphaera sp.]